MSVKRIVLGDANIPVEIRPEIEKLQRRLGHWVHRPLYVVPAPRDDYPDRVEVFVGYPHAWARAWRLGSGTWHGDTLCVFRSESRDRAEMFARHRAVVAAMPPLEDDLADGADDDGGSDGPVRCEDQSHAFDAIQAAAQADAYGGPRDADGQIVTR